METMGVAAIGDLWEIFFTLSYCHQTGLEYIEEIFSYKQDLPLLRNEKNIRDFISFVRSGVETEQWWMDDDPEDESKYRYGPIKGSLLQLAAWNELDHRTLKTNNGRTGWHIVKEHGRSFRMWFSSQHVFMTANGRRISEIAQNDTR